MPPQNLPTLPGMRVPVPPAPPASARAAWRRDPALRFCRTCYGHLAGIVGMAITDALWAAGHLEPAADGDWRLTRSGLLFCERLGVDLEGARRIAERGRRHFARQCVDWSERRPHVAGALGTALADLCFSRGWVRRRARTRTVTLTRSGRSALGRYFGVPAKALRAAPT